MKIRFISVGKLKEKYLINGVNEYLKRLSAYAKIETVEVNDEKIPKNPNFSEEDQVKEKEGKRILDKIKDNEYVILLDIKGNSMDSIEFSHYLQNCMVNGKSTITFVIGGSLGLSKDVYQRANYRLSFSKMTFPHQLMRLILVEQVYRAFKIMNNEPYHK